MLQFIFVTLLAFFLAACESNPPAPVIDRLPQASKPKSPAVPSAGSKDNAAIKTVNGKDWRPSSYIVKKGDTLFSIGLEHGYDYKEIAAANNLIEPYTIHVGQKLNLASLQAKTADSLGASGTNQAAQSSTEAGVVITPIKSDSAPIESTPIESNTTEVKPVQTAVTPILSEPKSTREPYSLEAFNKVAPIQTTPIQVTETKPSDVIPADTKIIDTKPADIKPADDEAITWSWPTQGKVVANFNEASNKGLDIGGSTGQAINAASSGKVIYSGSDLRGYGKLVIIKHNKTYLSVYAHNSKIIVKEGQIVATGQKIAEMGNTDSSTVKLHFEIRRLGKSVDPARYLNQN